LRRTSLLALVLTMPLMGSAMAAENKTIIVDVSAMEAGLEPDDFTFWRTGTGDPAVWRVVNDPTATERKAIAQTRSDTTGYRFPLAVYKPVSARNVDVFIRFKPLTGKVDQAGGVVVRLTTPDDYYVARANALEDNVRLYRVTNGKREQIAGTDTKVAGNQWHTLDLRANDDKFTVSFDGKTLFTAEDRTFDRSGKIALWTKADSVTHFDTISITPLD
ncbi:MAG TPA: family 16 glycoside hydrolase, partial [Bradyrhizobium sp.]|nr:family 16 glycoside hydrolase [Bradyrhizobium sp.]